MVADGGVVAMAAFSGELRSPKRPRLITEEEVDRLVEEKVAQRLKVALHDLHKPVPALLKETFAPNDPVHGLINLPAIVRVVVDTRAFQRMRQIKQLGICALVFPGAKHDRFLHSIGTAWLAHEFIKDLRQRQPELQISDRDRTCVVLAALCHDLGHPCFSHMFETFMHGIGRNLRKEKALSEEELKAYESWTHEQASVMMIQGLFQELKGPLDEVGLRKDAEGDDYAFICELIDPPKGKLEELLENHRLRSEWSKLMKGRPVEKAFLYEIVSNWRSGIDVDKFDYFRRDALYLGLHRQFDHERYFKGVKVIKGEDMVPTISPPDKDKVSLRDNMLELRKSLHQTAYQHKTVKKLEVHMIEILTMMDECVLITGVGGQRMKMSEAAAKLDPVAYPKLTDTFVESALLSREDPKLERAAEEYERRVIRRDLMRHVGDWDIPADEGQQRLPHKEDIISGLLRHYSSKYSKEPAYREVTEKELHCQYAKFHYGMGSRDPITRVLFHSTKTDSTGFRLDFDARPLSQKIFVFWHPEERSNDNETLKRLTTSLHLILNDLFPEHPSSGSGASVSTPVTSSANVSTPVSPARSLDSSTVSAQTPVPKAAAAPSTSSSRRRVLKIQSSCPVDMDQL